MLEYGPRGLIGVLTPQANTTVEAELWILAPPGVNLTNGRLTSGAPTMSERLAEYFDTLEGAVGQFGDAPLSAIAFACTGSSYLIGAANEAALIGRLEADRQTPIVTAARAILEALRVLGAGRVAFVSPYGANLTAHSLAYWRAAGLEVAQVVSPAADAAGFHPIYAIGARQVSAALDEVGEDAEAVVLLGTGMPSLGPILRCAGNGGPPVISSNLCLAWLATSLALQAPLERDALLAWIGGAAWGQRFVERTATTPSGRTPARLASE
jgi:maleate isomerase